MGNLASKPQSAEDFLLIDRRLSLSLLGENLNNEDEEDFTCFFKEQWFQNILFEDILRVYEPYSMGTIFQTIH